MRAAVFLALLGGVAAAQPAPAPRSKAAPKSALALPALETFALDNGLQVAFMHRDGAPVVSVEVWYHAGSKDEPHDRRGGYVNANTTEDSTHYVNLLPADYVDFAIQLEAERMRHLLFRDDMIRT